MNDRKIVRKPAWLSREEFEELLRRYDGVPRCEVTGETEDLVIDHIVPRWAGGTNDVSNLQFLAARINAKKGIRPDSHWSQEFYWDQTPNLNAFRGAQRLGFDEIVNRADWFGRPISQITRRLYVNGWVVAAGKTLGIAAMAWAVNHVIRDRWGAAKRADRVLIVTKEQAVRDQIADDLATDIQRYGIVSRPPRVAVVEKGWQFEHTEWLDQHDAVVTCVQQIWERDGGTPRADLAKKLAEFPVIAFDEPHFASEQVSRLVDLAWDSICFGFTGTPIDKAGELLRHMVALTVYGYEQAVEIDRSLKWLSGEPELFREFVHEIGIEEAGLIERGERTTTRDANKAGYGDNIEPAKSVVRAVISQTKRRDQLVAEAESIAPHRDPATVEKNGLYPAHPMVVCESVTMANKLCHNTNLMFEQDPVTYPRSEGWHAEVVHTDTFDTKGRRVQAKPLTPGHPWMRAKTQGYRIDAKCARLLFVVGIGREGVNNPPCGPIGIATSQSSVVEIVQRAIGRQLRAIATERDGTLLIPPAPLDTVSIITHETFGNGEVIGRAIEFVCGMEEQLADLPQIDQLDEQDLPEPSEIERDVILPMKDKIDVAGRLAELGDSGSPVPLEDVVTEFAGLDAGRRVDRIREWATKVREQPEEARKEAHLDKGIRPALIVTREQVRHEASDLELERHLRIHHPNLVEQGFVPIRPEIRPVIQELYAEHARRFHLPPLTSDDHIEGIRRNMARRIRDHLRPYFIGDGQQVYGLVGSAVKRKLDVREGESARNDSDWDIPQVHAILRRPDVQNEIIGWVTGRLIDEGFCPALAALRSPHLGGES